MRDTRTRTQLNRICTRACARARPIGVSHDNYACIVVKSRAKTRRSFKNKSGLCSRLYLELLYACSMDIIIILLRSLLKPCRRGTAWGIHIRIYTYSTLLITRLLRPSLLTYTRSSLAALLYNVRRSFYVHWRFADALVAGPRAHHVYNITIMVYPYQYRAIAKVYNI